MYLTWDDHEMLGKSWEQMRQGMDTTPGPGTSDYPEDCSVQDSVMSEIGEFDWEQWRGSGHDRQSVFADPLFVCHSSRTTQPWFGASVRNLRNDPELIDATGGQDYGVFLDRVPLTSKAAGWGLRPSDVIVECNGEKVEDVEQLLRLSTRAPR